AFAAFCGFQTALLLDRGFTGSQAGLLAAVRLLAGIIAQPTIGGWLDRHPQVPLKRVVTLMLGAGLAVNLLSYFTRLPLLGTALITLLLGILELNLYPLLDSLALQFINAGVDINYSFSRGLGSLAYAVACAVLGVLSAAWGTEVTLLAHMLALAGVILAVNLVPAPPEGAATEREEASHSVLEILKGNRSFTLMLLAVFFAIAAVMPVVGFLVSIVEERGGSETHLGWALFLMGAAELPAALLFPKLRERLGSGVMMLISVIFMAAKPLLFLVSPTLGTLLLAQLIQLPGYGFFTPAAVYYANESVGAEDRVRGQAIMMTASNGLGGMAGNLLAGLVVDWGGVDGLLMACTALGALGILFALASVRSQKEV
ncbi:MAG: MFS transporter, partial [Oscillibacter sp.]|nr:MFS transporter [Oscillibacter sp.]